METLQRTANAGSVSTGYDIDNSVKLEADNDERFTRTPSSAGNRKTWTFSAWVKRTKLGANQTLISAADTYLYIGSDDKIYCNFRPATENFFLSTTRLFRDTSAWYHIVVQCDTTDSTAADRAKLYINGVRETSYSDSTYENMSQNLDTSMNNTIEHMIGRYSSSDDYRMSGYISEFHLVDGTALTPTSFGEYDDDSGIWKPKEVDVTYGTNGFYLDFADASDLGDDESGNGNDWTEVNIAAADQATDTPTNNFCTLMPPQHSITGTATVVSEGGTQMKGGSTSQQNAFGSIGVRKGKWYFESNVSNLGGVASYSFMFGVIAADRITALNNGGGYYIGEIANTWGFTSNNRGSTGGTENPNFPSETATSGTTEVMGIALDMDNGKIWVHKAGTYATNNSSVTGNPATGAAPQYDNLLTSTSEHILVGGGVYASTNAQRNMNFGNPMNANFTGVGTHSDANGYGSFAYAPPSGYYAICTKNLAEYG